ncbi:alpha/beta hydrolase family protein [Nocardiopsis ansamitocini]|uniref:Alpha/beta hydrolase n=1 Tax=Nocardiopsis ansamitocini TaxID=1670832 RepID=A0A9W6P6L6_9ACTN|nr:alpha/beta hydrolase [Nocardiopsis ansamitocini]GLU48024.1 alpha/beta hydrolase [Nocardiopsis ansamitocini]
MPSAPRPPFARALGSFAVCGSLVLTAACTSPPDTVGSDEHEIAATEREVEFSSGPDTLFGTFAVPDDTTGPVPAALIISGSGPTDRDGNNPGRPDADTNRNFAAALADAGVASLRYDKLGSGTTGMASRTEGAQVDLGVFDQEVTDAYAELTAQPEVDPERLIVLGHSEGSLFALRAPELTEPAPAALILAAPVGARYLDVMDRQLTEQLRLAESQGMAGTDVDQMLSDTRYAIARVRAGEEVDLDRGTALDSIFYPGVEPFLQEIDRLDPTELAAALPSSTPTLVLWGTADSQVEGSEVDRLTEALTNVERVDIPATDHIFREYGTEPGDPVLDSHRTFAPEVGEAIEGFLARHSRP